MNTAATHAPLTIADATDLSGVIEAVQWGAKVRWLGENDVILEGIARSFSTENGAGFHRGDIRDSFLRISSWTTDHYLPMSDVLSKYRSGEFAVTRG